MAGAIGFPPDLDERTLERRLPAYADGQLMLMLCRFGPFVG